MSGPDVAVIVPLTGLRDVPLLLEPGGVLNGFMGSVPWSVNVNVVFESLVAVISPSEPAILP